MPTFWERAPQHWNIISMKYRTYIYIYSSSRNVHPTLRVLFHIPVTPPPRTPRCLPNPGLFHPGNVPARASVLGCRLLVRLLLWPRSLLFDVGLVQWVHSPRRDKTHC